MIPAAKSDRHAFFDDVEEASLLGFSAGPEKRIQSFEIEQARETRVRPGFLGRRCGLTRLLLFLSISVNIGLTILIDRMSEGRLSSGIMHPLRSGGSNHTLFYGHLHMAKTAGTELNGLLAAGYDHVCGNKGYSLDYFQYNERVRNSASHDIRDIIPDNIANMSHDSTMNRGRVPYSIMEEIGFEDCDWISLEKSWDVWPQLLQSLGKKWHLELHVPCRDPVDHLMSMCYYKGWEFDCRGDDLESEIESCIMAMDRFSPDLATSNPNIQLRCFASEDVDLYVEFMSQRLEPKRIPADYVHRESNGKDGPRSENHRHECLEWYPHIAKEVRQLLLDKYEYYRWCNDCLISDRDLLAWLD